MASGLCVEPIVPRLCSAVSAQPPSSLASASASGSGRPDSTSVSPAASTSVVVGLAAPAPLARRTDTTLHAHRVQRQLAQRLADAGRGRPAASR